MSEKPTYEELEHRVREFEKAEFEQKSSMDTFRENETLQNTLIESLPAGVIVIDPVTRIIEKVNNAAVSMFGAPREYIIGHRCHSFLCPAAEGACPIVDLGQDVDNSEKEMICMNGTRRPIIKSVKRVRLQGQEKLLECCVDITFQKQIEQALSESDERFRAAFMLSPIAIAISTPEDGRWIDVNQAALDIFGYTREEVIGESALAMNLWVNPNDRKRMVETLNQYGEAKNQEIQLRCKDDRLIIASVSLKALTLKGAKHFLFLTEDITERKQAENALKSSEQKWRSILVNTPQLGISLDSGANILFANAHFLEMTGWKEDEIIGHNWFDIFIPESIREEVREVFKTVMHQKQTLGLSTHENDIIIKNGEARNIAWSNALTKDGNGNITDITCLGIDLTERKNWEARLRQAQKMEAIGTLAGGIAHDFNNILFPIVGHTEMLLEDVSEDSPLRDSLKEIYTGSLRARDLVQQILAFSRQEKNELKLLMMQPIIKEAMKLIRSTIPTTIVINQNLQSDCGPVKADPTQIHQIVMNLATNAYHTMEKNGGELKITLKETELGQYDLITPGMTPGLYACLTVSDTGMGMNKNVMNRIFEPFFTTKGTGKGTGMGLSVVHGIVKRMNGEIQVYSEPDKGSEFLVYLPIVENAFENHEFLIKESILGGHERILLVDDEEAIIAMEKQALERLGYHITSRMGSIEALEDFRADPDKFDLIITDMAMPNMSGDKLAVELIKIRPGIPILLCTGYSESMTDEKIKSLGIKGFLKKPIVIKDLAKKLREILDNSDENILE